MRAGRLPAIAELIASGTRARVRSTIPTISPVAWSSFFTGMEPRNHRVLDWYAGTGDGRRPVTSGDRRGVPFWRYLNAAGLRTGIMNVPGTFPAVEIDGFMMSGFDAPSRSPLAFYPRELGAELEHRFGAEVLEHPPHALADGGDPERYVQSYLRHDDLLTEAAIETSAARDVNFLLLNYQTVDHFNHHLPQASFIDRALENLDGCIQRLRQAFPAATVLMVSDHGSRKTTKAFLLVDWLEEEGFLALHRGPLQGAAFAEAVQRRRGASGQPSGLATRLAARAVRRLPERAAAWLVERLTDNRPLPLWPLPHIDRSRSSLSSVSSGTCGFYFPKVNAGSVEAAAVGETRSRLIEKLQTIREPSSGQPLFSSVHNLEELFPDLRGAEPPDIIAVATEADARPTSTTLFPRSADSYFVDSEVVQYYGGHTLYGVGAFNGEPFVADGDSLLSLDLWDMAPAILYLHGIPVPEDADGRVPQEVFSPSFRSAHPMRSQGSLGWMAEGDGGDMGSEAVAEKLRALGYL